MSDQSDSQKCFVFDCKMEEPHFHSRQLVSPEKENMLSCGHCDAQFQSTIEIARHVLQHHQHLPKLYPCTFVNCGKCFQSYSSKHEHQKRHFRNDAIQMQLKKEKEEKRKEMKMLKRKHQKFVCSFDDCKAQLSSRQALWRHEKTHSRVISCKYENCTETFKNPFEAKRHYRGHEKEILDKQKEEILDKQKEEIYWKGYQDAVDNWLVYYNFFVKQKEDLQKKQEQQRF